VCRVGAGDDRSHVAEDGEVRDDDDVHTRVASGIAVGAELGQQGVGPRRAIGDRRGPTADTCYLGPVENL
jgi:hypothetical protein